MRELARQTARWLHEAGHTCTHCTDGTTALSLLTQPVLAAVILDVGLPVLFLTARDNVTDRVRGLKAGGDDYMTKPFAMEELLARLEPG